MSMKFLYLPYLHSYFHVFGHMPIVYILFLLEDIFWEIVM